MIRNAVRCFTLIKLCYVIFSGYSFWFPFTTLLASSGCKICHSTCFFVIYFFSLLAVEPESAIAFLYRLSVQNTITGSRTSLEWGLSCVSHAWTLLCLTIHRRDQQVSWRNLHFGRNDIVILKIWWLKRGRAVEGQTWNTIGSLWSQQTQKICFFVVIEGQETGKYRSCDHCNEDQDLRLWLSSPPDRDLTAACNTETF